MIHDRVISRAHSQNLTIVAELGMSIAATAVIVLIVALAIVPI